MGPIASLKDVVAGHMTSPVNLPHTLTRAQKTLIKKKEFNLLPIIQISLEYQKITFFQIRKKVRCLEGKTPI
jgi:hypothetical protein